MKLTEYPDEGKKVDFGCGCLFTRDYIDRVLTPTLCPCGGLLIARWSNKKKGFSSIIAEGVMAKDDEGNLIKPGLN